MDDNDEARLVLSLENERRASKRQIALLQEQRTLFARQFKKAAKYLETPIETLAMDALLGRTPEALSRLPDLNEVRRVDERYIREIDNQKGICASIESLRDS